MIWLKNETNRRIWRFSTMEEEKKKTRWWMMSFIDLIGVQKKENILKLIEEGQMKFCQVREKKELRNRWENGYFHRRDLSVLFDIHFSIELSSTTMYLHCSKNSVYREMNRLQNTWDIWNNRQMKSFIHFN